MLYFLDQLHNLSELDQTEEIFGKWVQYVEAFKVSDILNDVPATFLNNYAEMDASSTVEVDSKFAIQLQAIDMSQPTEPVLVNRTEKQPGSSTT